MDACTESRVGDRGAAMLMAMLAVDPMAITS
jgi:hypothetical protein